MSLPILTHEEAYLIFSFTIPSSSLSGFVWKPQRIIKHSYQKCVDPVLENMQTYGTYHKSCMRMIKNMQPHTDYITDEEGALLSSGGVLRLLGYMGHQNTRLYRIFQKIKTHLDKMVNEKMAPWILTRKELDAESLQIIRGLVLMEYLYHLSYDLIHSYDKMTDLDRGIQLSTPSPSPASSPQLDYRHLNAGIVSG